MIRYKQIQKIIEEPDAVICDVCKREYAADDLETQEFHHVKFIGGYASVFGDGTQVECDICQHCLKKLIGEHCRQTDAANHPHSRGTNGERLSRVGSYVCRD